MKTLNYTYDFDKRKTNICELIIENGLLNGEEFKINNVNFSDLTFKVVAAKADETGGIPCSEPHCECAFYGTIFCPMMGCAIEDIVKQNKMVVKLYKGVPVTTWDTGENPTLKALKEKWVGRRICKKSLKPFKFGEKIGTIKDVVYPHPHNNVIAFQIKEDDTMVEAWRCFDVNTMEVGPMNFDGEEITLKTRQQQKIFDFLLKQKNVVYL